MQGSLNLTGHILCAQPQSIDPYFARSVIAVAAHDSSHSWGLIVNKVHPNITITNIMQTTGIDYVVHTLDWKGHSTVAVTPDIGITGDVSILAAIAGGEGPNLYRIVAGLCVWGPGQLDGEYKGLPPWKLEHRWLDAPATIESVFNEKGDSQWQKSIEIVANSVISTWF